MHEERMTPSISANPTAVHGTVSSSSWIASSMTVLLTSLIGGDGGASLSGGGGGGLIPAFHPKYSTGKYGVCSN